jgi:transcriptional regulator
VYIPNQFREERRPVLIGAMRAIQLACLVTPGPEGIDITHLPVLIREEGDALTLEGHMARPNPHWRALAEPRNSVAVFQGPQAYISPGWYETKRETGKVVPTWNYVSVHAHGLAEMVDDPAWVMRHLNDLSMHNEAGRAHPWAVSDAPADYIEGLRRVIVGVRLNVERLEGSWKMIQHRPEGDRLGTIAGLENESDAASHAVADLMRRLEAERSA